MGFSEVVDSGSSNFPTMTKASYAAKSKTFMQTCNLLSQYLKQKRSTLSDLSLSFPQPPQITEAPKATMDLLPMLDNKTSAFHPYKAKNKSKMEVEKAPLTIFYAGKVMVFNDFPADKADEIITLATNSTVTPTPAESSATSFHDLVPAFTMQDRPRPLDDPALDSDLPMARKKSLAVFLEKRQDRMIGNAPYPVTKRVARKPAVEGGAWLALA